jgi:hypothetical protein
METARRRPIRPASLALVFSFFAAILLITHYPFIGMPLFWDEAGYFVPAALDLHRHGAWIPRSTAPSVHPPAVPAWLSAVWSVTGYSIPATRLAMLALAAAAVTVSFLLAIELAGHAIGFPGFAAAGFLLLSPVFYTQAMMAQLDMPAMLATTLALLLFLRGRIAAAAAASTLLVLIKGTGAAVPVALAAVLLWEGRRREAAWFAIPLAAMAAWLAFVHSSTGRWLGNPEFFEQNFAFQLHPARMAVAVARRVYYLFAGDFHWIGSAGVLLGFWRGRLFASRSWKVAALVAAAHLGAITVTGGTQLERYALPLLPIVYAAMAAGWTEARPGWRLAATFAMAAGLLAGWFRTGPFPQALENNLAMCEAVEGQLSAASFVENMFPGRTITTAWPLSDALRRPEAGYVKRALPVREIADFRSSTLGLLAPGTVEVFILYSREARFGPPLEGIGWLTDLRRRWFGFEEPVAPHEAQARLGLRRLARWERGGFWIEVMAAPGGREAPSGPIARGPSPARPRGGGNPCCEW